MPRGDRSGPAGEGPRTGWGMGGCAGGAEGDRQPRRGMGMAWGPGRGFGRGARAGRGMAWRRGGPGPWAAPEDTEAQKLTHLEAQASWLQQGLEAVRARLDELKGRGEAE